MNTRDFQYVEVEPGSILDEFVKMVEWQRAGKSPEGWRLGHALREWKRHAEAFARGAFDNRRAGYERAAAFGAARLRQFATLDELVDHYFDDRHYRDGREGRYDGMVPIAPASGTVECWVEEAIAAAGDDALFRPMVEELSFWRRSQELIGKPAV